MTATPMLFGPQRNSMSLLVRRTSNTSGMIRASAPQQVKITTRAEIIFPINSLILSTTQTVLSGDSIGLVTVRLSQPLPALTSVAKFLRVYGATGGTCGAGE